MPESEQRIERTAYLGLGSNLGDRAANLLRAVAAFNSAGLAPSTFSSIYETAPVDYLDQPGFLNMVIAITSDRLEPFSLLAFCLETETRLGRRRTIPRGARTIDIDLLLLEDLVVDETRGGLTLILPHPRMHLRRFVLTPMVEIAPHLEHPILGKPMADLLGELEDFAEVRIHS
jgi:2-amino-4-hydroxy-6-hydroxymethyldihydropteridine diphosphokinase